MAFLSKIKPENTPRYDGTAASDIARFGIRQARRASGAEMQGRLSFEETDLRLKEESARFRTKVIIWTVMLAVLLFLSLCVKGASESGYPGASAYSIFSPLDILYAIYIHAYNFLAQTTHLFSAYGYSWLVENVPAYYVLLPRVGTLSITLLCAVLLGVSGALYQAVFKNPIAAPGMFGVSSGVSFGTMLLVSIFGIKAGSEQNMHYILSYGCGAAFLLVVVLVGRKLSGKGKPFDVATMILSGLILSQICGVVVGYESSSVMDPSEYAVFYSLSQDLTVDISLVSWIWLGTAFVISLVPVWLMRFKLNALAFEEEEVRLMGINPTALRALALICGGIMILAAEIHTGSVAMVALIAPFLARSWFGCEFRKQLIGSVCISTILLVACRDLCDLIPFVGGGLAIGSVVVVLSLPLFLLIMSRHVRGWD